MTKKLNIIKGFKWMNGWDNTLSAEYLLNEDGTVDQTYYTDKRPLRPMIETEEHMYDFIKSRVVPENRANLSDWLDLYGLEEYDPERIFMVSKGKTTDDPFYAIIIE